MKYIEEMLKKYNIPKVARVKQFFNDEEFQVNEDKMIDLFKEKDIKIEPGQRIAITCGSRGIDKYIEILKGIVNYIKINEGIPILIPSMGSHGGATAKGQKKLLEKYGITEEVIGAEILSSMETIKIGETKKGLGVYIDKLASEADGIVLFNRVKPHTSFRGEIESGLVKMLAIGLAKQKGAEATHFLRYENMAENISLVGEIALEKLNIVCGVSTIENGYNLLSEIHISKKKELIQKEKVLLKKAWEKMPSIPLEEIDVLIVNKIGKEISGTGMDTNIVGRFHTKAAYGGPNTIKLGVCDLTNKSEGNANGMGIADFITKKMYKKIDFQSTYMNTLTSTEPASSRMPMVLENDELMIKACIKLCGVINNKNIRMVIINSTKDLDEIYMTKGAVSSSNKKIEVIGKYKNIVFDNKRNMKLFND